MTWDQIIAIAANIGTCIAVVLAYLALKETSQQRRDSYRPQLALKRQALYASTSGEIPSWTLERPTEGDDTRPTFYFVSLFNIGLGPAKSVVVRWTFDVEKLIEEINRLILENKSDRSVSNRGRLIEFKGRKGRSAVSAIANEEQTFDFALPVHVDAAGVNVRVPYAFTVLATLYFAEWFSVKSPTGKLKQISEELLRSKIEIDYLDIGGQQYHQTFVVNLDFEMIEGQPDENILLYAMLNFETEKKIELDYPLEF